MDRPLISVIVPVYNVEKYLDRCVKSITNQTYKSLEIILVDDGSPDSSPQICDEWAQRDSRIKVIHKQNGGAASARNTGLDNAGGDFIGFVDADDYIDPDMYENMISELLENNADACRCGIIREADDGSTENWGTGIFDVRVMGKQQLLADVGEAVGIVPVHVGNKLFKKECIGNIRFDTRFRFAEDTLFNFMVAKNIGKIVYHDINRYHYMVNDSSITSNGINENNFDEHRVMDTIFEMADEKTLPHCIKGDVLKSFRTLRQIVQSGQYMQRFDEIRKRIVSHRKDILKSNIYSYTTKLLTILLTVSPSGYKMAIKLFR